MRGVLLLLCCACATSAKAATSAPAQERTTEEEVSFDHPPVPLPRDRSPPSLPLDAPLLAPAAGSFSLAEHVGPRPPRPARAVVLHFGASWCGPCMEELPGLGALASRLAPTGVLFVIVDVDQDLAGQRELVAEASPHPLIVIDGSDQAAAGAYGIRGLPTLFLLDAEGRVRWLREGADPRALPDLESVLRALLDEAAPTL